MTLVQRMFAAKGQTEAPYRWAKWSITGKLGHQRLVQHCPYCGRGRVEEFSIWDLCRVCGARVCAVWWGDIDQLQEWGRSGIETSTLAVKSLGMGDLRVSGTTKGSI